MPVVVVGDAVVGDEVAAAMLALARFGGHGCDSEGAMGWGHDMLESRIGVARLVFHAGSKNDDESL